MTRKDAVSIGLACLFVLVLVTTWITGPLWAEPAARALFPSSYPTRQNVTTAAPAPLSCRFVLAPGQQYGADLCVMPDGAHCLFSRSGQPTVCYTIQGATDVK